MNNATGCGARQTITWQPFYPAGFANTLLSETLRTVIKRSALFLPSLSAKFPPIRLRLIFLALHRVDHLSLRV